MKILQISEYYFEFSGILVANKDRWSSAKGFIKNLLFVFMMGLFMCGAPAAFIYYNSDQFGPSVLAFLNASGGAMATAKYLALKLNENMIVKVIELFQKTVDEAPANVKQLYYAAEGRSRRLTKAFVIAMPAVTVGANIFLALCSASYNIIQGHMDIRKWYYGINMRIPYEQNTILCYFFKTVMGSLVSAAYSVIIPSSVSLVMNCHDLFRIGLFDIESELTETDKFTKERMVRVIKLHNRLLDLVELLSKIMSGPMFFLLLGQIGYYVAVLGILNFNGIDFTMIIAIVAGVCGIPWVFLYCFFATRISMYFERIGDVAYQSSWHNYPIDMQKSIILMIRRSQVPVQFHCLGMFDCNMETFGKIVRLVWSYYLMLKKIKLE